MLLLATFAFSSLLSAQVSIGIQIGPPPPPRVFAARPISPGPDYFWVDGYWYPVGSHYRWHAGYWTLPPYPGARWAPSHYEGGRFFGGYWAGERGRIEHDHRWDHDHHRDADRFREHGRDHGRDNDHDRH